MKKHSIMTSGAIWLLATLLVMATASVVYAAGESPMLAQRVSEGLLPSVEERLPLEPMVLPVWEEIGQYGGTMRVGYMTTEYWWNVPSGWVSLARFNMDGELEPQSARGWDFSEDGRVLTLHLREGMKWSDGHPFTADDFMFWYEDIFLNPELTPAQPGHWVLQGEPMVVEKIDDYTLRLHFVAPYPGLELRLAINGSEIFAPKHYLSQFHPNYVPADELDDLVHSAGYEEWYELFNEKAIGLIGPQAHSHPGRAIDAPTLSAYVVKSRTVNRTTLERNPYYWKVDAEGNQLPYVDTVVATYFGDAEVFNMQMISGELDFAVDGLEFRNFPLYMSESDAGDFRVLQWIDSTINPTYYPNHNHPDPVMRQLINDPRFKQALSLGINRAEINEALYFGLATSMQNSVMAPSKFYRDEYLNAFAEYDPDQANQLLDEIGLAWDSAGQYRLRPDGERLAMVLDFRSDLTAHADAAELVANHWRAIGIDLAPMSRAREYYVQRFTTGQHDMISRMSVSIETRIRWLPRDFVPMGGNWTQFAPLWGVWYATGGTEGEEPPEHVQELLGHWETFIQSPMEAERDEAMHAILSSQAENLWSIGVVGGVPHTVIATNRLRNVPDGDIIWAWEMQATGVANPETFFFVE